MEKRKHLKEAVIILSGGLDSTVLTYYLKDKGYNLSAISFNYGQKHVKELECALKTVIKLHLPYYEVIDISTPMKQLKGSSALLNPEIKMPQEHYTHSNQKQTVVPNRNMIMLSFAIGYAEAHKIKKVFYAAHKNDYTIYPDCRPEFVKVLNLASQKATYAKVEILAPFTNKLKSDLVKIGYNLNIPFEDTWSCYEGKDKACGKCGTCQERLEAFKKNKLIDPIIYG